MNAARHALSAASAASAALAALTFAASAGAATYQTTVSPNPFSFSGTEQIVYRLQVTTADQPERLEVRADAPRFPNGGYLMSLDRMTLEGPGTVLSSNVLSGHGDPPCYAVLPAVHGSNQFNYPRMEVEIPANSTSAIALPARPQAAFHPPWPGLSLAVEFRVGASEANLEVVRSPSPVNSGVHGVPISFQTDPRGRPGGCPGFGRPPVVPFGREVVMSGRAYGAVAGQLMTIRLARQGDAAPRDLATVRIGADGSFGYRWRPTVPGGYALGALYRSQSPQLSDDFAPAVTLRVAPPANTLRPVSVTAARRVRCRGRRCTILVRGSVKRPVGASAGCTGKVRLRVAAGRKRLLSTSAPLRGDCRYRVTRRFSLRSRRTRVVAVRVSYLGDGAFLPMTGRVVRVKIARRD